MARTIRVGSLFSGIGGLELGVCRAIPGAETIWQVEQNKFARAVLAKHWPDARRYEDVRQVGAHNLEPCEVLVGGFPCTDVSNAGKREGIEGEKSGLWREYARIIRELSPLGLRVVIVENVAALRVRGLGTVLGDLASCGFDAVWDCLPAAAIGANHRRDRMFVVAWKRPELADSHGGGCEIQREPKHGDEQGESGDQLDGRCERGWWEGPRVADSQRNRLEGLEQSWATSRAVVRGRWHSWWETEPELGRVANGVPDRVDRIRCLGNAVVPQVGEAIGRIAWEILK